VEPSKEIPWALKTMAVLFILGGIWAAIEVLVALTHSRISLNFGVLGIFVGIGLLNLRPGWRTCGLVFLWIEFILIPVTAVLVLSYGRAINFELFGTTLGRVPKEFALGIGALLFLLTLWQYRVLTRPDVRRLFGLDGYGQ
jgi:hypothetical protein